MVQYFHLAAAKLFGEDYRKHLQLKGMTSQFHLLLETSWLQLLKTLRMVKSPFEPQKPNFKSPLILSDSTFSNTTLSTLSFGPKFRPEPRYDPVAMVADIRRVATAVDYENPESFIDLCAANQHLPPPHKPPISSVLLNTKSTILELRRKKCHLLEADKDSQFVICSTKQFNAKALEAVKKNFRPISKVAVGKARAEVIDILEKGPQSSLAGIIKNQDRASFLQVFFNVKTHKEGNPFRSIVTEHGTWQRCVGEMLQSKLDLIRVEDPFLVLDSQEVISKIEPLHQQKVRGFSLDVTDLYYSLNVGVLLQIVEDAVLKQGLVNLECTWGMSWNELKRLTELYLSSTAIEFKNKAYVQKRGVCIGSKIAAKLSDLFMANCDRTIKQVLDSKTEYAKTKISRYVDDQLALILEEPNKINITATELKEIYEACSHGLKFTIEEPMNGELQFLDMKITLGEKLCWRYSQRSEKALLPQCSSHSKIIKDGNIKNLLTSAIKKSCDHGAGKSLSEQVARCKKAGYNRARIESIASRILRSGHQRHQQFEKKKVVVIEYRHNFTHALKKTARKFGTNVVMKFPRKLKTLKNKVQKQKVQACDHPPGKKFVACKRNVVYEIPCTCGQSYIGQSGRCVNTRLSEHLASTTQPSQAEKVVPSHLRSCNARGGLNVRKTKVLAQRADRREREVIEAFYINKKSAFSTASTRLRQNEIESVRTELQRSSARSSSPP
jgi:hypothetical protein